MKSKTYSKFGKKKKNFKRIEQLKQIWVIK